MSWYRQYRPQTVSQLHLISVRTQLLSLLESGKIPHGLLLTGPKGTGKTSSARILAKVLNCEKNAKVKPGKPLQEPCEKCSQCRSIVQGTALYVVEMDAASNRRIDDIRALKEQVYFPPAMGEKSVYIIDEVHMLTTEAFNALLKVLEEPPAHAVFFLATTDLERVPPTIVSRCTVLQFQKASTAELHIALQNIAKQEKINAEDEALGMIAESADGSFRDAVKMFEHVCVMVGGDTLTAKFTQTLLQPLGDAEVTQFITAVLQKDERAVVDFFQQLRQRGVNQMKVYRRVLEFLSAEYRKTLGVEAGKPIAKPEVVLYLLKQFSEINMDERVPVSCLSMELCALEMILKSKQRKPVSGTCSAGGASLNSQTQSSVTTASSNTSVKIAHEVISENVVSEPDSTTLLSQEETFSIDPQQTTVLTNGDVEKNQILSSVGDGNLLEHRWHEFLQLVGKKNLSIEALLRTAQVIEGASGSLLLRVFYQFHKDQLELQRYRSIVEQCLADICGGPVRYSVVFSSSTALSAQLQDHDNISGAVHTEDLAQLAEKILI